MLSACIVLALLFVVLLLCSSLPAFHPSSASPASSSSLPLSPSVDICGPASAPLFCTPSPLISPSHTHSLSLYHGQHTCACEHSRQPPPPPTIPTSHLTAYYCSSPRRGLTAGNINRMARSDMHTHANTLCSVESLIPGQLRTAPRPPPQKKYCPLFSTMHNYANHLAAARHPLEIVL